MNRFNPEVTYVMYCFLKGTPAATSAMKEMEFTTVTVAAPKEESAYVRDRLENSAIIDIALDKEADIDWIVFNKKSMPNESLIDGDFIRKREENISYRPIDFGSATAKISQGDTLARATITISNIERDVYYNFYAVAKSSSGGGDSKIIKVINITPADKTSPTVQEISTTITNYGSFYAEKPYNGTVTLVFSEPMFYIPAEGQMGEALSGNFFANELGIDTEEGTDDGKTKIWLSSYQTALVDSETGVRALKTATIGFSNVYNNTVISFPYPMSDKNTNIAGYLTLKFVDAELKGGKRGDSLWEFQFSK